MKQRTEMTAHQRAEWDRTVAQRSYRYVRASLIGLFVALVAAVAVQTIKQDGWLTSISAYYYTPAQAVFVGALVAIGAAMIALRGVTTAEEVALNIGGMFAPVIAIVPTARSSDAKSAIAACNATEQTMLLGSAAPTGDDCLKLRALRDATRANVENNMTALLILGGLALIATLAYWLIEKRGLEKRGLRTPYPGAEVKGFVVGFAIALTIYFVALITFTADLDWFIDKAHATAAIGLFACILVDVVVNGWRKRDDAQHWHIRQLLTGPGAPYFWMATVMVVAFVVLLTLLLLGTIELIWLEAALLTLFVFFWGWQTRERWDPDPARAPA